MQHETLQVHGHYEVEHHDLDGKLVWKAEIDNVVATVGKNLAFDTFLAGSAYTVTGPYIGLISSVSFSAVSAADTMASHAGWLEAGSANAPTYSGNRPTCAWSAATAGAKALSPAATFTITGSGTVEGCFIVYGSAATNAVGGTVGTLWSAGTFTGGALSVSAGTLTVNYSVSM